MRWRKRGLIFDPAAHALPAGCIGFAQSPQALVFNEFVRIYFSTRAIDPHGGKYLSHVAFVDMARDLRTVLRTAEQTPLPLGGLGCFDEHGIFPMSPVRHEGAVYGYTCGWSRRVSVSVETAIGLAISHDDGLTFTRIGPGPVLSASQHEPYLVGDGFVRIIDGVFHMWYIFGTSWKRYAPDVAPDRTYKIGHAVSTDGIRWVKEEARQIVPDQLGPQESQALPTVLRIGTRYHMLFCFRESYDFRRTRGRGYRLGHAWSDDLSHWTRDDAELTLEGTAGDWDADMQCYPHLFECDGEVCLLYNGNAFGRGGFGLAVLER